MKKHNLTPALVLIGSLAASYGLMSGKIQEVVYFADPINEIACFLLSLTMVAVSGIALFSKTKEA